MRISLKQIGIMFGIFFLLVSCEPSDKYVGDWYALSHTGEEVMINFSKEKTTTITSENGEEAVIEINQSSTGFINEVRYFGIEIEGKSHYVVFENKEDESNAILIKQTNHASDFEDVIGDIVYKMNRDEVPIE